VAQERSGIPKNGDGEHEEWFSTTCTCLLYLE